MKTKTTKKCTVEKKAVKKTVKTAAKSVKFTLHADKGKSVYLAGEFNNWDPAAKKLAFRNGIYSATIKLASGTYQYKFVVDGIWCCDPENVECVPNDQGTFNSVVTVK